MNAVELEKNRINRLYFDKVLNTHMKSFLTEAILYAFGSNFSLYWENFIYCTEEKELGIIFRQYTEQQHLGSLEQTLDYIRENLAPADCLKSFDISKIVKTILLFKEAEGTEPDPRKRENFDAFCKFYNITAANAFSKKLHSLLRFRNSTTGHPSDVNVLNSCTAKNFTSCVKCCQGIIDAICESGKVTDKMQRIRDKLFPQWQEMLEQACCVPYSLYQTNELRHYTIGTIKDFLQDKNFGKQINYVEDEGDIFFLDIPVKDLVNRIDTYLRAQQKPSAAAAGPAAPKPTPAPASRPPAVSKAPTPASKPQSAPRRRAHKGCLLLLLIPLAFFIGIFAFVFKFLGEQFGVAKPTTVDNLTTVATKEPLLDASLIGPHISGTGDVRDVVFISVDQVQDETLVFIVENKSVYPCQFGWVSAATCYVKTEKGSYVQTLNGGVEGATRDYFPVTFEGLEGKIETITFEGIILLKQNGLPSGVGGDGYKLTIKVKTTEE